MPTSPPWFEAGLPHVWLPYTQMQLSLPPLAVKEASGCEITLEDGRVLIDGIASWWTMCHGYKNPTIVSAMQEQLHQLPHIMFGGLVHEPALSLAQRLSQLTGLERVFFSDSGSVAVEVAMKMALQYWRLKGKPTKDRFLCFEHGYHGDTLGAMSVSDPEHSMHKAFKNSVIKQFVWALPSDEYGFSELESLLAGLQGSIAGIIIEPLVQGAGGMHFHSADVLAELRRLAREYNILFIADEIATGFWRTGTQFSFQEAGILPDILCLGKALTGGHITLAATLASAEVYSAFANDSWDDALMHGPTFMANPLACAAANASLEIFATQNMAAVIEAIEAQLRHELGACRNLPHVVDVRVKGAIGVVEIDTHMIDIYKLRPTFIEKGVWIRPFGNVIYLMPAFTITPQELSKLTHAIFGVLSET